MRNQTRKLMTKDGLCTLTIKGNRAVMTGPSGRHEIMLDGRTDVWAHWRGFLAANGGVKLRFGKIGPKQLLNPWSEIEEDDADWEKENAFYHSFQDVFVGNQKVGELERDYRQPRERGDSASGGIFITGYDWYSEDDENANAWWRYPDEDFGDGSWNVEESYGHETAAGLLAEIKRNLAQNLV